MKHFVIYRKLILIIGTATAVVSVGVFFFMEDILFRTLFISFAFVFLGGLLFLLDFLHNRYNDNLLEEITLLIEALVEQQERTVFPITDMFGTEILWITLAVNSVSVFEGISQLFVA